MEKIKENREARVHAIGWAGLMGSFGGSGADPIDLLPNPEAARNQQNQRTGVSRQTKAILLTLVKENRLHPAIAARAWIAARLED